MSSGLKREELKDMGLRFEFRMKRPEQGEGGEKSGEEKGESSRYFDSLCLLLEVRGVSVED